jgi:pyruvate,water dikinase
VAGTVGGRREAGDPMHQQGSPTTAWTIANTSEVVQSVLTPFGASTFWGDPCELELRRGYASMGIFRNSDVRICESADERMVAVVFGRLAANVDSFRRMADSMPGTSGSAMEEQYFGSVRPEVPDRPTRRRYPVLAAKMPAAAALLGRRMRAVRAETELWWRRGVVESPPTGEADARALLVDANARYRAAMRLHMQATALCQGGYEQMVALAGAAGRPGLEMRLATGFGGIEETAVLRDLWEVSRERMPLGQFLSRHGYHGSGEGEPSNPSWRQSPELLIPRIEAYRALDGGRAIGAVERERARQRLAAERELFAALGLVGRLRALPALRAAAAFIRTKETGKVAYTQAIDGGRCAAHVLGEALAVRGLLGDPSDVFFLTFAELTAPALPADAKELVARRRERHTEFAAMRLPANWIGTPTPQPTRPGSGRAAVISVSGQPVCGGTVEGRLHLVDDPDDADDVEPGDVLACHVTDPSWMPLLSIAGALVIDVGGPMSHCAIAARELGIPAVISTGNGTELLRTGDVVRVDADSGLVTVLEPATEGSTSS